MNKRLYPLRPYYETTDKRRRVIFRKLTEEEVAEIRMQFANHISLRTIARKYNVTSRTIDNIKKGKTYKGI